MRIFFNIVVIMLACADVQAQTTTLSGVYTSAQAQRGARTYKGICANCHEGGEPDAEPLFGEAFIERWREEPLDFLYGFYSKEMPSDDPGVLGLAEYQDVLAYLLQQNGYAAGNTELKAEQLSGIQLVGTKGPAPLPPAALVRIIGCLQPDGGSWQLTKASRTTRVRRADEISAEESALAAGSSLGNNSYRLQRAENFTPASLQGKKVQAKGMFNIENGTGTLSVLSLAAAGAGC